MKAIAAMPMEERLYLSDVVKKEIARQQALTRRAMAAEAERARQVEKSRNRQLADRLEAVGRGMEHSSGRISCAVGDLVAGLVDRYALAVGTAIAWWLELIDAGVRGGLLERIDRDDAD